MNLPCGTTQKHIDDYWNGEEGPYSLCLRKPVLNGTRFVRYFWDWVGDFETYEEALHEAKQNEEMGFDTCIQNEAGDEVYQGEGK